MTFGKKEAMRAGIDHTKQQKLMQYNYFLKQQKLIIVGSDTRDFFDRRLASLEKFEGIHS